MTAQTFTAPSTYAEVSKMLGGEFILPNGETLRMTSCGHCGNDFSAGFGSVLRNGYQYPAYSWSSRHGFESDAQTRTRQWDQSAAALKPSERALIIAVMGDVFARDTRADLKSPAHLVKVALNRLINAGRIKADTCTRCGGSGHYSRCEMYGTTCFKCSGKGRQFPPVSKALKVAIRCEAA